MKRFVVSVIAGFLLTAFSNASAQDQQQAAVDTLDLDNMLDAIVVTATRTETPLKEIASSVTVVTAADIERKQQASVSDVLRGTPGLDVVQSGGRGRATSFFLRGTNSDHTLVLVDGVEMNDPISAGRSYDFANLSVDNIERIEVLRGPQSTLYGSDAMGGVINIITKRGNGRPALSLLTQGGSLGTFRGSGSFSGGDPMYNYSLGLSWQNVQGFSAANKTLGNIEKDNYRNATLSGKIGATPREHIAFDLMFRIIDATSDLDNGGGIGQDDPNNRQDTRQIFIRPQVSLKLWNRRWQQTIGYAFSDHDRENNNPVDPAHPVDSSESTFKGRIHQFDWQNTVHLHEYTSAVFGIETEEEQGNSIFRSDGAFGPFESIFTDQSARITGYYLQDQIQYRNMVFATAGIRVDNHSLFGRHTTYRLAPAIFIEHTGTRLKGTYGTGFKAPSLFQLYSSFGSPTLQPGKSTGWDVGIEQYGWGRKLGIGLTYFRNDFTNLIDFDNNTFTYSNISAARTQGTEWFGRLAPVPDVRFQINYTYTDTEDKSTGLTLVRRPRHKWRIDTDYDINERANVHLGVLIVGKRENTDFSTFPSTRVTLNRYEVVNLAASYRVLSNLQIFGRIDNLFDKSYEEVLGFGTPGVSAYAGIRLSR